jgi:hypothetical protein
MPIAVSHLRSGDCVCVCVHLRECVCVCDGRLRRLRKVHPRQSSHYRLAWLRISAALLAACFLDAICRHFVLAEQAASAKRDFP